MFWVVGNFSLLGDACVGNFAYAKLIRMDPPNWGTSGNRYSILREYSKNSPTYEANAIKAVLLNFVSTLSYHKLEELIMPNCGTIQKIYGFVRCENHVTPVKYYARFLCRAFPSAGYG